MLSKLLLLKHRFSVLEIRVISYLSLFLIVSGIVQGVCLSTLAREGQNRVFAVWCILMFVDLIAATVLGWQVLQAVAPVSHKVTRTLDAELKGAKNFISNTQQRWERLSMSRESKKCQFNSAFEESSRLSRQFQSDVREILDELLKITGSLEKQASTVQQMTASLSNMSTSVKSAVSLSDTAVASSRASESDAKKGFEVVNKIIKHMNKIIKTVSKSAKVIRELTKRSDEIVEIINVIDDIAEQTNLLSLNAAIEAARAGPQGRGFAVVADQVRSLAKKTTHATKEIASTLSSIQEETSRAVAAMNEGIDEIDIGQGFAVQAGVSLRKIVAGAQKVSKMISRIATASEEQSQTSANIDKLVNEVSHEAGFTWDESKAALSCAQGLEGRIQKLSRLLERFVSIWSNDQTEEELIVLGEFTTREILLRNQRLEDLSSDIVRLSNTP